MRGKNKALSDGRTAVKVRVDDRPDPWIVAVTAALVVCGLIFVFDTSYFFSVHNYGDGYRVVAKHVISILIGAAAMRVMARCPSEWLERRAAWVLGASLAALALTAIPGVATCANGACRWISLAGVFNFQPAEVAKVGFVIFTAAWLTRHADRLRNVAYGLLPICALVGLIGVLLLLQPDFGTAVLVGALAIALMFLAGVPTWQLAGVASVGMAGAFFLIKMSPYRVRRFVCFLDPSADPLGVCWQLRQALMAFGSGQLTGQGLGASTQKSGWLPEAHTDFIFSVIGEETGLVGAAVVFIGFAVLAVRGFRVAHRHPDMFGQMLAAGITLVIVMQAMLNMGVILGLLPTKGIGLPYISYGGSSVMVFLASTGLLMALSRELRER